jgi:hypothetical protein
MTHTPEQGLMDEVRAAHRMRHRRCGCGWTDPGEISLLWEERYAWHVVDAALAHLVAAGVIPERDPRTPPGTGSPS